MANEVKIKMTADDLASGKIKGVGKSAQTATDKLRGMRGAFIGVGAAGGAILGALGIATKTFAQVGDEIQKMSLRTALTTEVLSEYRFALEQSGSSIEGFEKSIRRMASFIQDGRDGLTTTTDALDTLGVAVKDLEGLGVEDAFVFLSSALADVEDDITQAALAQDLFGRSGTALLPLLAQGADGIAALREEAQDLGIVFDQDMANSAARLIDAQNTMAKSTEGLQIAFAQHLAPALSSVLETIGGAVGAFSAWADKNPALSKTIVILAGALGTLLIAGGAIGLMIPTMAFAYGGLTTAVLAAAAAKAVFTTALWGNVAAWIALHAATGGIFLAIAIGITALIAVLVLLVKNWDTVYNAIKTGINLVIESFEILTNIVIDGINLIIEGVNKLAAVFGKEIDTIANVELPKLGFAIEHVDDNTQDYFEHTQTGWSKTTRVIKEEVKEQAKVLRSHVRDMLMTDEQWAEDIVRRSETKYAKLKKDRWADIEDEKLASRHEAALENEQEAADERVRIAKELFEQQKFIWQSRKYQQDKDRAELKAKEEKELKDKLQRELEWQKFLSFTDTEAAKVFENMRMWAMSMPARFTSGLGRFNPIEGGGMSSGTAIAMSVLKSQGARAGIDEGGMFGRNQQGDRVQIVNVNVAGSLMGSDVQGEVEKAMSTAGQTGSMTDQEALVWIDKRRRGFE